MKSVHCAVWTGSLNKAFYASSLKGYVYVPMVYHFGARTAGKSVERLQYGKKGYRITAPFLQVCDFSFSKGSISALGPHSLLFDMNQGFSPGRD